MKPNSCEIKAWKGFDVFALNVDLVSPALKQYNAVLVYNHTIIHYAWDLFSPIKHHCNGARSITQ